MSSGNDRADAAFQQRMAAPGAPTMNTRAGEAQSEMSDIEAPTSVERDARGLSYIANLIALYLLFGISLLVIAWFGIFSEA